MISFKSLLLILLKRFIFKIKNLVIYLIRLNIFIIRFKNQRILILKILISNKFEKNIIKLINNITLLLSNIINYILF